VRIGLRGRLLLANLKTTGLASIVLMALAYFAMAHILHREFLAFVDDEVGEYARDYQPLLDNPGLAGKQISHHFEGHRAFPVVCRIYDSDGRKVVDFQNVPGASPLPAAMIEKALTGKKVAYKLEHCERGYSYRCGLRRVISPSGKHFAFEMGMSTRRLEANLARLRNSILLALPLVLLINFVVAWWATRSTLAPFGTMLAHLGRIRSSSLDDRLPVSGQGDELDRLAVAVNDMLAEVEKAFAMVKEFTGDAAHELRTPLAKLNLTLESSLSRELSADQAREILDDAYEQCVRLRSLVDDLMLLARLDAGEVQGEPVPCDLGSLVTDLGEFWNDAAQSRGVRIETNLDPSLVVAGHPVLLRRLLANLAENSLRYTPAGGNIQVSGAKHGNSVVLCVADSGPGIPPTERDRVFRRFYRSDQSRDGATGGTGLGLSIARKIVNLHRGTIEVADKKGGGCLFRAVLPTGTPDQEVEHG